MLNQAKKSTDKSFAQATLAVAVFVMCFFLGKAFKKQLEMDRPPVLASLAEAPMPGHFLACADMNLDQILYLYNAGHLIDQARKDILFLGNSRMLFTFRHEALELLQRDFGLSAYQLAIAGEGARYTRALIRKHDLRPKWVFLNADNFLIQDDSLLGEKLLNGSPFDAFKLLVNGEVSFFVKRHLHRQVPYLSPSQPIGARSIFYRSIQDGSIQIAAVQGKSGPLPFDTSGGRATKEDLMTASLLLDELKSRGAKIILICIPPSIPPLARELARIHSLPLIVPEVPDLWSIDQSHMDYYSATRYSQAVIREASPYLRGSSSGFGESIPRSGHQQGR